MSDDTIRISIDIEIDYELPSSGPTTRRVIDRVGRTILESQMDRLLSTSTDGDDGDGTAVTVAADDGTD